MSFRRGCKSNVKLLIFLADDDDLETGILVYVEGARPGSERRRQPSVPLSPLVSPIEPMPSGSHGLTASGASACCRLTTDGIVDCQECLQSVQSSELASWSEEDLAIATFVLKEIANYGAVGMKMRQLAVRELGSYLRKHSRFVSGVGLVAGNMHHYSLHDNCRTPFNVVYPSCSFGRVCVAGGCFGFAHQALDCISVRCGAGVNERVSSTLAGYHWRSHSGSVGFCGPRGHWSRAHAAGDITGECFEIKNESNA